ncbi:DUF5723 family protein [Flavobacteriaceae bacterium]|jgi:hypothetical protein|nr:DUF5723 family protein [Flavobacteriaceae bacterium]
MKKFLFIYLALGLSVVVCQNKQLLYNWEVTPQTLMLNPGSLVSSQFHAGMPLVSQFHFNAGSSGVSVFDIFADDGVDINTKITNIISELSSRDFFTINQQLDVLNFGWLSKGMEPVYFSGGMYQELDVIAYFPKDIAILAWEGNRDYIGKAYDFNDVSARADLLTVYHFGVNKQISKKLTAGVRLKLYSSLVGVSSTRNKGAFKTSIREGTANVYEHTVTDLDVEVKTSGFLSLDGLEQSQVNKKLLGRALLGGNLGIGLDAGITYQFDNQLSLTASVLDLGAIFHTNDTELYRAKGDYTLDGIELIFPELVNGEPAIPYYDNLEDDIAREIPVDTLNTGYTQLRPTKINAGLHYDFGRFVGDKGGCNCKNNGTKQKRVSQAGVQYFSIFRPRGLQFAGTLYYTRRFGDTLSIKTTYTLDSYSAKNVGAGLFLNIRGVNLFLAADNLLQMSNLAKANSVSLQVGLNYILN